jgi:hypothetical protein
MEAVCSYETSVDFKLVTRLYIPEDKILQGEVTVLIVDIGFFLAATARSKQNSKRVENLIPSGLISRPMYGVLKRVTGFKGI